VVVCAPGGVLQGIIHRDIKPDNIGVHKDHKVALFDWGEALTVDQLDHLTDRALAQQVWHQQQHGVNAV